MMPNINGRFVPDWHSDAVRAAAAEKKIEKDAPEVEDAPVKKAPAKRVSKKKAVETAAVKVTAETADQ